MAAAAGPATPVVKLGKLLPSHNTSDGTSAFHNDGVPDLSSPLTPANHTLFTDSSSHLKSECPQRAQGGGGGGRQCYNCYEYGHSKADCPNPRKILCRNCDSPEHVARDCDKPKDWTRVKCNNCGNMGHGVKKCPEPIKEDANGGGGDWGNATAVPAQGNWGDDSAAPAKGGCDQDEINKASGDWNGDAGVAADTNDFSNGNGENGGGQDWNGDAQDVPQTTW